MPSENPILRKLFFKILLASFLFATHAFSRNLPNEIGIGIGLARFFSEENNQMMQGSIRFDREVDKVFSLGVLADFTAFFCPVCDNAPDNSLNTISLVGASRYEFRPFQFQAGIGIGIAKGEEGVTEAGEGKVEKFTSVNLPFVSRVLLKHDFQRIGFGIGFELKYHLNFKNNALFASVPLIMSF